MEDSPEIEIETDIQAYLFDAKGKMFRPATHLEYKIGMINNRKVIIGNKTYFLFLDLENNS